MSYLLDTCVLSELVSRKPDDSVVSFVDGMDEQSLHLSVLTLGELHKGIAKLGDARRRKRLLSWVENDLRERFRNRILPVDVAVARTWGRIQGEAERKGRRMPVMDSLIAATAIEHELVVVTRNTPEHLAHGVDILDPWAY